MVLNITFFYHRFMKYIFILLFSLPFAVTAQNVKLKAYDASSKKWRAESFPVSLKAVPEVKMDAALRLADTAFYLRLMGTGVGTNTIDVGSQVVFVLENDSTVVATSTSVQSIDYGQLIPVYRHEYAISLTDLERLGRHNLKSLRKYSAGGHDDVIIEKKNAAKMKQLTNLFIAELKKENALPAKLFIKPPGFPGGKEVLLAFLNRNLKPVAELANGEKKMAVIEIQVAPDGSVNNINIQTSAGTSFDNELVRILHRMPRWKPALQNGQPVDGSVTHSFTFINDGKALKIDF
jgi:TonB family protein